MRDLLLQLHLPRVVQQPLRSKLEVFRTPDSRGWGLRTLADLPAGAFVTTYVGNLYESEAANRQGRDFGDEYFADLDLLENVERHKEGWESDVVEPEEDEVEDVVEETETSVESVSSSAETSNKRRSSRVSLSTKKGKKAKKAKLLKTKRRKKEVVAVRKLFGEEEEPYIMDAKTIGNIGRYMNHSCRPNTFVQNVFVSTDIDCDNDFVVDADEDEDAEVDGDAAVGDAGHQVDSHDLRFPWVAFFTTTFVRAGTELVWDYNYQVYNFTLFLFLMNSPCE